MMAEAQADQPGPESPDTYLFHPTDEAERIKIREQLRGEAVDRRKLAFEKYVDQMGEERIKAQSYSKEYGQTFIRTVFLLNGGAILSLLTFIGSMYGKSDLNILVAISLGKRLVPAFYYFAAGLGSAALIAAIGYFNWGFVANSYAGPGPLFDFLNRKSIEDNPKIDTAIHWSSWAGILFAVASLFCFIRGTYLVSTAFTVLGIE
jgi:hypothetical protein